MMKDIEARIDELAKSRVSTEALILAEYQSLRQESEQARVAQQTILNWSFGSLSLLVAAGASQLDNTTDLHPGIGVLFGVAIPAFLTAAALIWIGEMSRMERVGFFLRRWERLHWSHESGELQGPIWENFLSFDPASADRSSRKHWATYLGGATLYGGGVVGSLVIFLMTHDQISEPGDPVGWLIEAPGWTATVVFSAFVLACLYFGIPVLRRGKQLAERDSLSPARYEPR